MLLKNVINISIASILITLVVGFADIATTSQYRLFFLYSIPVLLTSFYSSAYYSLFLGCLSTSFILVSSYVDHGELHGYNYWNAAMILLIFISITILTRLLSRKKLVENEKIFLEEKNRILSASLEEKEVLIRESNHRIKNNLQALNSLITITAGDDRSTLVVKLQNRIQTFTVLYDKLSYASGTTAKIPLRGYLEEIIQLIIKNYDIPRDDIVVAISGGDFQVYVKSASLFGMIINELVTNSIRHGFEDLANAQKKITLRIVIEENALIMMYGDNGRGFDYSSISPDKQHLGSHLINALTKQLGGELSHNGEEESSYVFTFHDALAHGIIC